MKRLSRDALDRWADERDEHVHVMTEFDAALIGVAQIFTNRPVAVYSYRKIIAQLMCSGMGRDEAEEYFSFNMQGAYVGDGTPAIMYDEKDLDNGSI